MRPFTWSRARSEAEAFAAIAGGARCLAGGTTLVDLMREEVERPARLVDINALPWDEIRAAGDDLVVGALARMSDVAAHPDTRRLHPLVAEALVEGASPQLRNMASIGGNLLQRVRCPYFRMLDAACNKRAPGSGCAALDGVNHGHAILGTSAYCVATHPSDLAVALVALDATVRLRSARRERTLPVEELFLLPGATPHREHALAADEMIREVRIPGAPFARRARYLKVRDRSSYEFALVSVAAALDVSPTGIRSARLAAGGVGTRPWRLRAAEASLAGRAPGHEAFAAAAALAVEGARPLAHNGYKVELLRRTVVRALELAMEDA